MDVRLRKKDYGTLCITVEDPEHNAGFQDVCRIGKVMVAIKRMGNHKYSVAITGPKEIEIENLYRLEKKGY